MSKDSQPAWVSFKIRKRQVAVRQLLESAGSPTRRRTTDRSPAGAHQLAALDIDDMRMITRDRLSAHVAGLEVLDLAGAFTRRSTDNGLAPAG